MFLNFTIEPNFTISSGFEETVVLYHIGGQNILSALANTFYNAYIFAYPHPTSYASSIIG